MPYIVVKNDSHVLSRPSPAGLPQWLTFALSEATEHRYAITFETHAGALKCAGMQGGNVHQIGDWDAEPPYMDGFDYADRWVDSGGIDSGLVEVVDG